MNNNLAAALTLILGTEFGFCTPASAMRGYYRSPDIHQDTMVFAPCNTKYLDERDYPVS